MTPAWYAQHGMRRLREAGRSIVRCHRHVQLFDQIGGLPMPVAIMRGPGTVLILILITGAKNLRGISLFPMNQQAMDLLMNAPTEASAKQPGELHVRVLSQAKK
jgi:hypothetical protein